MSLPFTQGPFGLPCPTTIFTLGMLAFLLGMHEDLGLLAAGLAGVWLAIDPPARARPA